MLRYLGGIAVTFLLGAVAACDARPVLRSASAESAGVNSLNLQTGARVNRGDAAMSAEAVGRQPWGDSLAVLIAWHLDSVRRYEIGKCRPDDQPAENTSEAFEAVLDGREIRLRSSAPKRPANAASRRDRKKVTVARPCNSCLPDPGSHAPRPWYGGSAGGSASPRRRQLGGDSPPAAPLRDAFGSNAGRAALPGPSIAAAERLRPSRTTLHSPLHRSS